VLRFGQAVIDIPRRQVVVDDEPRHLEPQAFDLLVYLVTHRDRVVPKHELLDEVWGDQFVSESALTTRVKEIRRALGDDGVRQAFVRNFRGRGYRFVAAEHGGPPTAVDGAPSDSIPMIGRDDDCVAVFDALERSRLVTLVGPGGVGKTTLAREIGRQVRAGRTGTRDVRLVQLATVRDDSGVRRAFEQACDIADPTLGSDALAAAIAELDALVVVDDCEHVVAAAARFAEAIVRQRGPVTLLATSRERLGVGGEQVVPVEPLGRAASRALLVERAREARPDVEVDPDDIAVDRLLTILDDLPLAIEMAAARLADVGVPELVELLGERLDLLRSAHRGVDARHRTLAEVIGWSERLLDPGARRVLHDMSVFAGPVTAADIAAVVGSSAGELTLGPLADLVEHSLVVADPTVRPTRYRLLGTVRAVIAPQRNPAVDDRHARQVVAIVEDADHVLRGPYERDAVRRIQSLEAEIRVAHRWARDHDHALAGRLTASLLHYAHERQWSEPATWARELLDDPCLAIDPAPFAAAVAADASNRDDVELATRLATTALGNDDPRVAACAHDTIANVGMYSGDLASSAEHGAAQRALGERVGDSTIRTFGLLSVVLAAVYGGDPITARRTFGASRSGTPLSVTSAAWLAYGEGELLSAEGDDRTAIERFRRAVELGTSVDNRFVVGVAQVAELAARARAGDITEAIRAFEAVLVQYRRTHHVTHAITALRNLIVLLVRDERDEPAMRLLGALSGPAVKATYGTESAELAAARAAVEFRCGAAEVERWIGEGDGQSTAWALDMAIALLAAASTGA
jgi:predicted ATPase/DNA-binding winged helix-turn-helix (wHTH) protein